MVAIHPSLLARFRAIQAIFFEQWLQVPLYSFSAMNQAQAPMIENPYADLNKHLQDLVINFDEEDDDSGEGGGRGTAKGLRIEKGMSRNKNAG